MHRLRALLAASFLICFLTTVVFPQEQSLQLGTPVERQIAGHESHTYTVTLEENQFVQLVVDQRGIDLLIRVSSPAGKSLGDFDSPNGDSGAEDVSFVGITAGVYRITVTPLDQGQVDIGKYEIKLVELRQATEQEIARGKNLEIVKAKGIALLSEVQELIPEVHSPQTRIRAQLQAAQLLSDIDEKQASKYFNEAMNGVKEFLATVDVNTQYENKNLNAVAQIRYEIIQVLAGRDPDAALSFLNATKLPPANYGNPREQIDQDRALELTIADQMIAKDPKRTLELARQILKNGYSTNLSFTLRNLRQKYPDLAADFANEIVTKLLGEKLLKNRDAAALSMNMMGFCNEGPLRVRKAGGEIAKADPLLSESTCRDLFQKAYQEVMSFTPPPQNTYSPERDAEWNILSGLRSVGQNLDTTIEGAAAAMDKKFAELNGSNPYQERINEMQKTIDSGQTDAAVESVQKMPDEMKEQSYIELANLLAQRGDTERAKQIVNDNLTNPYQKHQMLANFEQQDANRALTQGKTNEALRRIANIKLPRERANIVGQMARQLGTGQKRSAALNFLEQARGMLAPGMQAQDQDQMNALLELSRAFSRYDAKRAFEIVDPLIDQLNELCTAAHTMEGFGPQYYDDDELDLQNGSSVANAVGQMSAALGTLAITNFERAKQTSDRLRLPEVRLRAYLEIAQQTIQGVR